MIDVRISKRDGTFLDVVVDRTNPTFQEVLNDTGNGKFTLRVNSPCLARTPNLLDYGNVVRMRVGTYTFAWLIEKKSRVLVSAGEQSEWAWEVSGRGVLALLQEAIVYPEYGLRRNAGKDRFFSWVAGPGDWYKAADWHAVYGVRQDDKTLPVKAGHPKGWNDGAANWIWSSNPKTTAPGGNVFFRRIWDTTVEKRYTVYATADNAYELYIDGQKLLSGESWQAFQQADVTLPAGRHTVAIKGKNEPRPGGVYNPSGVLMTIKETDTSGNPVVLRTGTTGWVCHREEEPAVGFTPSHIMTDLLTEAISRGVEAASIVTRSWTPVASTEGVLWGTVMDRTFQVGTDYLDVLMQLVETSCDTRMTSNFTLELRSQLGIDRTVGNDPIVLRPAWNVTEATFEGDGSGIRTSILIQSEIALTEKVNVPAVTAHGRRESYLQVGSAQSDNTTNQVVNYALNSRDDAATNIAVSIRPMPTQMPFDHYRVGDWVLAPNEKFVLTRYRIRSITVGEEDDGTVTYVPELSTIIQEREARFNRWLKSMANGTMGGSVASASAVDGGGGDSGGGGGTTMAGSGGSDIQFAYDWIVVS